MLRRACARLATHARQRPLSVALRDAAARTPARCFSGIAGLDDVVILTASAAKRIAQLEADGKPARLRLQIDGGGCSGFEYKFEVEHADAPTDDDDRRILTGEDVVVLVNGRVGPFDLELVLEAGAAAAVNL